ncbi:MAG: hypothetical protein FWE24_04705 [Defluviitaleaceae bacterium]|nr:hypothetical protein [Defluviitaleaceae bacterium]
MICKGCKTAVNDNSKICIACGRPVMNNSIKWKCLAALLTGAAAASIFLLRGDVAAPDYDEPDYHYEEQVEAPSIPLVMPELVSEQQAEIPLPSGHANFDKPILEIWAMLDEVSALINEYYSYHSQTVLFLSKNGYLFDDPANAYILINELYGITDIDERFLDESLMFFYFRPIDLSMYRNLNVSEREDLVIFTGFETREGFAITGAGEQGGIISREDLSDILDRYSWNHGEIRKIDMESDIFETVIRALVTYTGINTGFDIRYMYQDERYISVVASPRNNPLNIRMFILEYVEGAVFVRLSGIETFDDHRRVVNNTMPDFNHNLLPPYDLRLGLRNLISDFTDIIEAMVYAEFIAYDDLPPLFASGAFDYVYFEFDTGMRFLVHLEGDSVNIYPVEDYEEARALLNVLSRRPPFFIIKQG